MELHLTLEDGAAVLELSDDGVGFDLAAPRGKGGMGLVGMRERAEKLGAKLELHSSPGEGTTVKVTLRNGSGGEREGQV